MKAIAIIALTTILAGCESCEDQGGKLVFSHYQPVLTGKIVIMQPIYTCEARK